MTIQKIKVMQESGAQCEYCSQKIEIKDKEAIEIFFGDISVFLHTTCTAAFSARLINEIELL